MNQGPVHESGDASHADLVRLADQCVLCGLCLPYCPTYALDRQESESPRGRVSLIHALAEGRMDVADVDFTHLDHCLSCRRCEAVCPAGVEYGRILDGGRRLRRDAGRQRPGLTARVGGWLLAHPRLLRQLLFLSRHLWRWLPGRLRNSLPAPPARAALTELLLQPSPSTGRGRIGLFRGCISRCYAASAQQAAIDLLQTLGHSVTRPAAQTCCGAQAAHAGNALRAARLAAKNHRAFQSVDVVVTLDSGCHEALSRSLDAETIDMLALLDRDPNFDELNLHDHPARVAVFAPCTQRNVIRSDDALRRVLGRLPGVDAVWLETGCCGAAGDHMLRFPERAATLREPLLQQLTDSGCDQLLVANIGCQLHLQAGIAQRGLDIRVRHPVEFIAERLLPSFPSPEPPRMAP